MVQLIIGVVLLCFLYGEEKGRRAVALEKLVHRCSGVSPLQADCLLQSFCVPEQLSQPKSTNTQVLAAAVFYFFVMTACRC